MKGFIGPIAMSLFVVVGSARLGSAGDLAFVEYEKLSTMVNNLNGEMERLRADNADLRARLDSSAAAGNGGGGCNFSESCQSSCCNCYWFEAGAAAVFLRPNFDNNVAYQFTDVPAANVVTSQPFAYNYEIAPRVWLGLTSSTGLGVRTSYFGFDHSASRTDIAPAGGGSSLILDPQSALGGLSQAFGAGATVAATHSLELHVIDLEATQRATFGDWQLLGSFGLRYASFEQNYTLLVNGGAVGTLAANSRFSGIGPTAAFEMYRNVGTCWTLFSVARGSVLFGDSDWQGGDPTLANRFSVYAADGGLTVGELQAGIRYSRGAVFVQSALEGQAWLGTQSITRVDEDIVLAGFSIGAGLQY